jgi:hypothetical protein
MNILVKVKVSQGYYEYKAQDRLVSAHLENSISGELNEDDIGGCAGCLGRWGWLRWGECHFI